MAKSGSSEGSKRQGHKRVKSYLLGGPPIESLQLFTEVAKQIDTGQVQSLRALSRSLGFSASHLGKWLPEFATQINLTEADLVELPTAGRSFVLLRGTAKRMLPDIYALLRNHRNISTQVGGMADLIACGTWQWLMGRVFHTAVARFAADQARRGERTGLRLFEYSSDAMMADLDRGVIDLGFGAPGDDLRALYANSLEVYPAAVEATSELVAVAPAGHHWEGTVVGGAVQFSELVGETLCVIEYDRLRQFARFRPRGASAGRLLVVVNYASVLGVVGEAPRQTPPGRVVGIVPRLGVQTASGKTLDPALEVFNLAGMANPSNRFAFWVRKSGPSHPEFEEFIKCVAGIVNELWTEGDRAAGPAPTSGSKRNRRQTE